MKRLFPDRISTRLPEPLIRVTLTTPTALESFFTLLKKRLKSVSMLFKSSEVVENDKTDIQNN